MSRIIVKNIGQNTSETELKDLFSAKGEVTDVRIIKTASGKSRQFAFVGFRNEDQSREAKEYYDNSFLHTSKLSVEIAKPIGDKGLEKVVKSRYAKKKYEKNRKAEEKRAMLEAEARKKEREAREKMQKEKSIQEKKKGNQKDEFMAVMEGRKGAILWGNSSTDSTGAIEKTGSGCADESDGGGSDSGSDVSDFGDDIERIDEEEECIAKSSELSKMSDLDYLRSKIVKTKEITSPEEKILQPNVENDEPQTNDGEDSENRLDIEEDGRLFIRNIPFSCVEEEITLFFSQYGTLSEVHLPLDSEKKCKGFGFVQFLLPEDATRAMNALDGSSFQGRLLHVMLARQRSIKAAEEVFDKKSSLSTFQQKREAERKKLAHKRDGWNSSYVRSDAVIDALSDKYGVSRGDILDTEGAGGGEIAVRLAIGETHVIKENQEYFASHGVNIDVLESALRREKGKTGKNDGLQRSTTTLLVKNLPHDLIEAELEDLFTKYGSISSFLIPKSKTVALVDYVEPSEARQAFKGLAYRKYHHTPLYLEWAPLNTIDKNKIQSDPKQKVLKNKSTTSNNDVSDTGLENESDFSTLFIKNLNFSTEESSLKKHLSNSLGIDLSSIRAISIPRKKKGDLMLSMGFGFVEFSSTKGACLNVERINGSVLDGHQLVAKPSDKRISSTPTLSTLQEAEKNVKDDESASSKLLVKNIAFQATQEEIRGLFSTFGAVKRIRLPKKMGGSHRGFAFVDLSSKKEASIAMKALSSTHLYGRHLVIEYAKEDDEGDLMKLRGKALNDKQAIALSNSSGKKRKANEVLQSQEEQDLGDILG